MNKQTFQYAVLTALTGCIMVGSMNHAMAASNQAFGCTFKENNENVSRQYDERVARYTGSNKKLRSSSLLLLPRWKAQKARELCDRAKAGEDVDLSCGALNNINYDEIDAMMPDEVRALDRQAIYKFAGSLNLVTSSELRDAIEYCKKIGVTK